MESAVPYLVALIGKPQANPDGGQRPRGPRPGGGGIHRERPFLHIESTSAGAKTLNNPTDRSMITSPSDLAPTVPVSSRGAGEEAFAHMSRDGSQAMVQAVILELSVKISRRVVLLEASSNYPTRCSEDMAAFAWIQRTLEDVEATLIGLSAVRRRRSAAFQGPPPSSDGNPVS